MLYPHPHFLGVRGPIKLEDDGVNYRQWLMLVAFWLALAIPAAADFIGGSDQQVRAVAEPILENLLAGFNRGDYAQYARDFGDTLKEAISEKKFQQVRSSILKNLGQYQSRSYLGYLKHQRTTVVLWKGRFSASEDDVLIKLVASKRRDQTVVVGLWFQ
jgi:hypothetical protein